MSEQMPPSNTGHGHVWPRPDGIKARCGGPAICRECARDAARNAAPAAPPAPTDYTGLILRLKREGSVTVSDRFDAADALTALLRERDALWACVEAAARIDAERELAEARAERDGARSQRDHVVKQLTRIHSFMTPENVRLPDGHVFEFNNPRIEHEMLHALSDAIRAALAPAEPARGEGR